MNNKDSIALAIGISLSAIIVRIGLNYISNRHPKVTAQSKIISQNTKSKLLEFKRYKNGHLIQTFTATVTKNNHRVTPYRDEDTRKKTFALLGGSFAFGDGLRDNETLAFLIADDHNEYVPLNFGSMGGGVNRTIGELHSGKISIRTLKKPLTLALYVLTDMHISRALGKTDLWKNGANDPYFTKDSGRWISPHSMKEQYPNYYIEKGNQERLLPGTYNKYEYEYFCNLLVYLKEEWLKQSPQSKFLILYFPDQFGLTTLSSCLIRQNIKVLDYIDFKTDISIKRYLVDGHPAQGLILELSKALLKDPLLRNLLN